MTDQEINEAVAKKLGWRKDLPASSLIGDPDGCLWIKGSDTSRHFRLPGYCHSIEAAWEIVEKNLTAPGWRGECSFELAFKGKNWRAGWANSDGWASQVEAATVPMAICLAFLKLDNRKESQ